jgi:hypothetical protein
MSKDTLRKMSDIKCPAHHRDLVYGDSERDKASCAEHNIDALLKCPDGSCPIRFSMQFAPESSGFFTFDGESVPVLYWAKPAAALPPPDYKPGE